MDKLRHALDRDADKLATRIEAADAKRETVFAASHGIVAGVEKDLKEVEDFVADLESSNGGPLDDSSSVVRLPRSSEVQSR